MDTSRLLSLLEALDAELREGYEERLIALVQAFTQQRDSPGSDNSATILNAQSALTEHLIRSPVNDFVPSWLHMMEQLGIADLFGAAALRSIESVASGPAFGPVAVVNRLEEFRARVVAFQGASNRVREGLATFGLRADQLPAGTHEIGILIPGSVTKDELGGLTKQLREWNQILRGFAELVGDREREVKIRRISSGSIELYAVAALACAKAIGILVRELSQAYVRIYKVREHRQGMVEAGVPEAELKPAEDFERKALEEAVAKAVDEALKLRADGSARGRDELRVHIGLYAKRIAVLIENGVEVEVSHPRDVEDVPDPAATNDQGEALTPEQLAARQQEVGRLRDERRSELERLRADGAALGQLPKRDKPIFQLTDGQLPKESDEEDGEGRAKRAAKK